MTRSGVWGLQDVRDKYLQSEWVQYQNLYIWGGGPNGVPGLNQTDVRHSSPIQLPGQWNMALVDGGSMYSSMGVKADGTMWTWGSNSYGMLGAGLPPSDPNSSASSPIQLPGSWDSGYGKFELGRGFKGALKQDGSLWTWGHNQYAMLGQNNTTNYSSPRQLPGTWTVVTCGHTNAAAIKGGDLYVWGFGAQKIMGPTTPRSSPYQIGNNSTWSDVCLSKESAVTIKTDGTLWAWGKGEYGQTAQNSETDYSSPRTVGTATNWAHIGRMGGQGSFWATNTSGDLYTWGNNEKGQLGHNNRTEYSSPRQIPGTWDMGVRNDGQSVTFTKDDGTLWCWGNSEYGNSGQNNTTNYSSPVQVPGTWTTGILHGNSTGYQKALS